MSKSTMSVRENTERRSVFERLNENAPVGTQLSGNVGLNAKSKGGNNKSRRSRINDTANRQPFSETSANFNPRPNKFFAERRISSKVKQLKAENEMAQNLADTALAQTQILLNEKAQLNSEKMRLEAELRRLSERLEMAERYASFTSADCTIQETQDDEDDYNEEEEEGSEAKRSLNLMHTSDSNDDTSVDCQVTQAPETMTI